MKFSEELEASLKEFMTSGMVDLHENGGELRGVTISPEKYEQGAKSRCFIFGPNDSNERLVLSVERFELEVVRVGLAESWRRGLRVVMRQ